MDLNRKIDFAIKLLQSIPQDGPIEVCYSGGKDSDVILDLAKWAGIPFDAIYKNTTIDPPGTAAHCREKGVRIVQPEKSFLQLIEQKGFPTRRARFCCEVLKEYKIHDRAIQGIRRSESAARAKRYKEPEFCREFSKDVKVRVYLPILEWTNEDVAEYIALRGIKCHPLYYDTDGNFHVERRLGCIGCPLLSGNGKEDFELYPKMLKAWLRAGARYLKTHPKSMAAHRFKNVYNLAYHNIFCDSLGEYEDKMDAGLFPELPLDTKLFLENYFKIDLTV